MFLNSLSVLNFKNIPCCALEFTRRLNCFTGDNGAGKTNLLDALHYLSLCKSALSLSDTHGIRHNEEFFMLEGNYTSCEGKHESVICSFSRNEGKKLKRNSKEYDKLSQHIGLIPLILISPADIFLVSDAAEERRRYINSFLSQLDRSYLNALMRYNHALSERNKLLKESNKIQIGDILDVLDMQLTEYGKIIHTKREEAIRCIAPIVEGYYKILSNDREQVELIYHSELNDTPFDNLLQQSRDRDRMSGFSTVGIHRDDLKMKIGGYQLKKYGSQGQQKSFLVALKLAQYCLVSQTKKEKPILLLDDLFDKFDVGRIEKLMEIVSGEEFGQIFITDCNKHRLQDILKTKEIPYSIFNVCNGEITVAL